MGKSFWDNSIKTFPRYLQYKKWFEEAKDNERFIYYQGCSLTETNLSYTLGRIILQDAYKGEVLLFQRRTKNMHFPFEYIAIRRRKAPRRLVPNKLIVMEAA